jgi:hypothetical protein
MLPEPETFRIGSPLSPLCKPDQMKVQINSPGFSLYFDLSHGHPAFAGLGSLNSVAKPAIFLLRPPYISCLIRSK